MDKEHEEALQILLDHQNKENFPLKKAVESESLDILLPKMKADGGFATQTKASWEDTATWLKEAGLIEDIPNIDDIFIHLE